MAPCSSPAGNRKPSYNVCGLYSFGNSWLARSVMLEPARSGESYLMTERLPGQFRDRSPYTLQKLLPGARRFFTSNSPAPPWPVTLSITTRTLMAYRDRGKPAVVHAPAPDLVLPATPS